MIVENMTGAGSRVAANYLYRAPPDGLTIGNFIGSLLLQQIMGDKGIEFDGEASSGSARQSRTRPFAR